jgi:hypothetical protein
MSVLMSTEISKKIRELIAGAAQGSEASMSKEVAEAAGALLVYAGMGGALAVTPEGGVVLYDFDERVISAPEEGWQLFALKRAAKKFPELLELAPSRPSAAVNCPSCGGRGVVFDKYGCGDCWGLGWTVLSNK